MINSSTTKRLLNLGIFSTLFSSVIKISSFFKVSLIFGSFMTFFSMSSVLMPLTGAFGGAMGVFGTATILLIAKSFFFGGFIPFKYLAYHIPGVFAALYWTNRSAWFRIMVPAICMAAFLAHPVGGQAWAYSLYWFIPMILYCVGRNNLFLEALGSTFIAHAVGSAIWIYAVPMTPMAWLALIPVVAIERIVFAAGMVIVYKTVYALQGVLKKYSFFPALLTHKN